MNSPAPGFERGQALIVVYAPFEGTSEERREFMESMVAHARELGAGAITWATRGVSELEPAGNPDLERPMREFLSDLPQGSQHQPALTLGGQGISTLRDLLAIGAQKLKGNSFPGVGDKAVDSIRETVARLDSGLELKERPTIHDMAAICSDLSQVPVQAVLSYTSRAYSLDGRVSVLDVLYDPQKLRGFVSEANLGARLKQVRLFAQQFTQVKADMARRAGQNR